ncbi:MAG: hypothetical protein AB7L90_20675 [Hyphomicrobiaceae bacterium]
MSLLMVSTFAPRNAEAGLPIPCKGEHLVLVKDLPPDVKIQTDNGLVHIDLGYNFSGCTSGRWVGYSEAGQRYYDVPESVLELYALRTGLRGLPPEPAYFFTFSASWRAWLWTGIALVSVGALAMFRRRSRNIAGVAQRFEVLTGDPADGPAIDAFISGAHSQRVAARPRNRPPI